ncbi:MAG: divergent PAP2 family protein [Oscillospiraceae bacterium]|nr:divergent PAP2 family protein [Oscillospiraceae bacterium]
MYCFNIIASAIAGVSALKAGVLPLLKAQDVFDIIFSNHLINVALLAWFIAQVLKVLIEAFLHRKVNFRRLVGGGGMPSSHAACVCALAAAACKTLGISSPIFGVAAVLAFIVMYDASNVRQAAGEQAKILNYMIKHWKETTPEIFGKELKEFIGHTPFQVIIGAALGIGIGILI